MTQEIHLRISNIFLTGVLLALLSFWARPLLAHGEDRFLQEANLAVGAYRLTLWTAPARLRTGEMHVEMTLFGPNGRPDQRSAAHVTLTPLDQVGPTLATFSIPVAGAEDGLREAAFHVAQPGRYRVETTIYNEDGAAGKAAFEVTISRVPRWIKLSIYGLLGASLIAGAWMLRKGIDVWYGGPK